MRIFGLVLNTLGVLALWFGGVPYREKETFFKIGELEAKVERDKKVEIPPPVGAGLVGAGSALLLFASLGGGRKKKD